MTDSDHPHSLPTHPPTLQAPQKFSDSDGPEDYPIPPDPRVPRAVRQPRARMELHPELEMTLAEQMVEVREDLAELHEKLNLVARQNDLLVRQNNLIAKQNDFCIRYVQAIALSMGIRETVEHIDEDIRTNEQALGLVGNGLERVRDELIGLDERMVKRAEDRERDEVARLAERGKREK